MNDIESIVLEVAKEYRQGETHRWKACELVHDAYAEFGARYPQLTASLCFELALGDDQVRNLGHAWELREQINLETGLIRVLSVTHFSKMWSLKELYWLTDEQVRDWLEVAAAEHLSVARLAAEVAQNHDGNPQEEQRRRCKRLVRDLRKYLTYDIPEGVRLALGAALEALDEEINHNDDDK